LLDDGHHAGTRARVAGKDQPGQGLSRFARNRRRGEDDVFAIGRSDDQDAPLEISNGVLGAHGADNDAVDQVRKGEADVAFLTNPVTMEQLREVAFAGEVMPQKSTDFFPKLLSGLAIYALD